MRKQALHLRLCSGSHQHYERVQAQTQGFSHNPAPPDKELSQGVLGVVSQGEFPWSGHNSPACIEDIQSYLKIIKRTESPIVSSSSPKAVTVSEFLGTNTVVMAP